MNATPSLKRSLSLPVVTFYGIGAILGAGIYVLIGKVAGVAGYYSPYAFVLAAFIAIFSAFSYAELAARFPQSAGEAVYVNQAFARKWLTISVGLLVVVTGVVSAATMATGVVGYVQLFMDVSASVIIATFVVLIGAIALWGIKESALIVVLITLVEMFGLLYVCFVSADQWQNFPMWGVLSFQQPKYDGTSVMSGLLLGTFLAFYAYVGFEDMVNVAEEVVRPAYTLPRAIGLALVVSTSMYMLVSFSALSVLSPAQLSASNAPLASVVEAQGKSTEWIGLVSLIAVVNGAIVQLIMASRVLYGLSKVSLLPPFFAKIHPRTSTPVNATILCVALVLALSLFFSLVFLAQLTSFIVLCIFSLVNVALLKIRSQGGVVATVQYPLWVPIVGFLLCLFALAIKLI